jgi:hypothetical protein
MPFEASEIWLDRFLAEINTSAENRLYFEWEQKTTPKKQRTPQAPPCTYLGRLLATAATVNSSGHIRSYRFLPVTHAISLAVCGR